jgi:threonine/homoserine/homoserine lactone efflux protein
MLGIVNYGAFVVAGIILNLTPGVDFLYVLGKSVTGGVRVGVASALGISGGAVVHTLLVAFGLAVVLMSSAWLFWVVKLLGACYLVVMGVRAFLSREAFMVPRGEQPSPRVRSAFFQGVITNVTNPKIILFFLAFLPQFVDPAIAAAGPAASAAPFLILGFTFIATSTLWSLILALCAGQFKRLLERRPRLALVANRGAGVLYILLGISVFFTPLPR